MTKSLSGDAISSVVVNTSAGGIKVSGESGQSPRVEVYVKDNHGHNLSRDEIKQRLDRDYDLNISVNGHELDANVKNKRMFTNWRESLSISFKIYVPANVSSNLHTSGGGIQLDNLNGNETFGTSGGGLAIDRLNGVIRGNTSGGGIEVSNSGNDIDLETSGGGIIAKNCNGKIKLVTSGGGLILTDLKGDIYAHTSGGGVEGRNIEGQLITGTSGGGIDLHDMACSLEANTSAGSLVADMRRVGKFLRLSTSAGNIDLTLPAKQGYNLDLRAENISSHVISGFTGDWKQNHVNGSVNGGGIDVDASASSGNIDLKFN